MQCQIGAFEQEKERFKGVIAETAFILRTFFFIVFGYSFSFHEMRDMNVLLLGLLAVAAIYLVRVIYVGLFSRIHDAHVFMIAPRGLVSILLFYAIPSELLIPQIGRGVLMFVVVATSLVIL